MVSYRVVTELLANEPNLGEATIHFDTARGDGDSYSNARRAFQDAFYKIRVADQNVKDESVVRLWEEATDSEPRIKEEMSWESYQASLSKGKKGKKSAKRKSADEGTRSAKKATAAAAATPLVVKGPEPFEEDNDESPTGVDNLPATAVKAAPFISSTAKKKVATPRAKLGMSPEGSVFKKSGGKPAAKSPAAPSAAKQSSASPALATSMLAVKKKPTRPAPAPAPAPSPARTARSPAAALKRAKSPARKSTPSSATRKLVPPSPARSPFVAAIAAKSVEVKSLPQLTASFLADLPPTSASSSLATKATKTKVEPLKFKYPELFEEYEKAGLAEELVADALAETGLDEAAARDVLDREVAEVKAKRLAAAFKPQAFAKPLAALMFERGDVVTVDYPDYEGYAYTFDKYTTAPHAEEHWCDLTFKAGPPEGTDESDANVPEARLRLLKGATSPSKKMKSSDCGPKSPARKPKARKSKASSMSEMEVDGAGLVDSDEEEIGAKVKTTGSKKRKSRVEESDDEGEFIAESDEEEGEEDEEEDDGMEEDEEDDDFEDQKGKGKGRNKGKGKGKSSPKPKASSKATSIKNAKADEAEGSSKSLPAPKAKAKAQAKAQASGWGFLGQASSSSKPGGGARRSAANSAKLSGAEKKAKAAEDIKNQKIITEPQKMFDDMVANPKDRKDEVGAKLAAVARDLAKGQQELRLGTMCSGTEAPLMALDMINDTLLREFGEGFRLRHRFSAEIIPFKQAYINRNFSPDHTFKDLRELYKEKAHTAYGAEEIVPLDVDILVAGTSCKDYSNKNNFKKSIHDKGQSGDTFFGMLEWVIRAMPAIIILENVCGAPWGVMEKELQQVGYTTASSGSYHDPSKPAGKRGTTHFFDTKFFYIPHTRTRGYLIAIRSDIAELPKDLPRAFLDGMKKLERPAPGSLEAFLQPASSAAVSNAQAEYARKAISKATNAIAQWDKCELIHQSVRMSEGIGTSRPITHWQNGVRTWDMPSWAWNKWGSTNTERVADFIDISHIRLALGNIDSRYKTIVMEASQNIDRSDCRTQKIGITGCLTPGMVPYVGIRGGPFVGQEALSLQGIPTEDLNLPRESEDNLNDFAGNAMTTTVVGAVLIQGLLFAKAGVCNPNHTYDDSDVDLQVERTRDTVTGVKAVLWGDSSSSSPSSLPSSLGAAMEIEGENNQEARLSPALLSLAMVCGVCEPETTMSTTADATVFDAVPRSMTELLSMADASRRRCLCEGECATSNSTVQICQLCGESVCKSCQRHPKHLFVPADALKRLPPSLVEQTLTRALPMVLSFRSDASVFSRKMLEVEVTDAAKDVKKSVWEGWLDRVSKVASTEFTFAKLSRGSVWVATYLGDSCKLELRFQKSPTDAPMWLLYVEQPDMAGELRDILAAPVARATVDINDDTNDFLRVNTVGWQIRAPSRRKLMVGLESGETMVDTFQVTLGVPMDMHKHLPTQQPKTITISRDSGDFSLLDRDITGVYEHCPDCATSLDCLYKRVSTSSIVEESAEDSSRPMFFFHDPERTGLAENDSFVFADNCDRLDYMQNRNEFVKLKAGVRLMSKPNTKQLVSGSASGVWVAPTSHTIMLTEALEGGDASTTLRLVDTPPGPSLRPNACAAATVVMACRAPVPLGSPLEARLAEGNGNLNIDTDKPSLGDHQALSFVMGRIELAANMQEWTTCSDCCDDRKGAESKRSAQCDVDVHRVGSDGRVVECTRCAPAPPSILWVNKSPPCKKYDGTNDAKKTQKAEDDFKKQLAKYNKDLADGNLGQEPKEDTEQAAKFEKALRREAGGRPFEVNTILLDDSGSAGGLGAGPTVKSCEVRLGVNPTTLAHSARTTLSAAMTVGQRKLTGVSDFKMDFRLVDEVKEQGLNLSTAREEHEAMTFRILSNKSDPEADLPPHWNPQFALRPEQRRGLTWMLAQEAEQRPFTEVEVSEARLAARKVRAEGRCRFDNYSRGGIVADQVGFGKTAISLAIVDCDNNSEGKVEPAIHPRVAMRHKSIKATLVIVPAQLPTQWNEECDKFLRSKATASGSKGPLCVIKIDSMNDLKKLTTANFEKADIVLVSMTIWTEKYFDRFEELSGVDINSKRPNIKGTGARQFEAYYENLVAGLGDKMEECKSTDGGDELVDSDEEEDESDDDFESSSTKKRGAVSKKSSKDWKRARKESSFPSSSSAEKLWSGQVKCPVFEMFHWRRVVVDEFTYASPIERVVLQNFQAHFRWFLSATPSIEKFEDVRAIAKYMGINLGRPDAESSKMLKEVTEAEKFRYMCEEHSASWYNARDVLAQEFLDRFMRQNIPEIDEIMCESDLSYFKLSLTEDLLYKEQQQFLELQDMKSTRTGKAKAKAKAEEASGSGSNDLNDKDQRLQDALAECKTPQEALIKQAAGANFDPENTADAIVEKRTKELDACKVENETLRSQLYHSTTAPSHQLPTVTCRHTKLPTYRPTDLSTYRPTDLPLTVYNTITQADIAARAVEAYEIFEQLCTKSVDGHDPKRYHLFLHPFKKWLVEVGYGGAAGDSGIGDPDAADVLHQILFKTLGEKALIKLQTKPSTSLKSVEIKDHNMASGQLKERMHHLRSLHKELVGRCRSLRFFETILKSVEARNGAKGAGKGKGNDQGGKSKASMVPKCVHCNSSAAVEAVLSCCGHSGCEACLCEGAKYRRCPVQGCEAQVLPTTMLTLASIDQPASINGSSSGGSGGSGSSSSSSSSDLYETCGTKLGKMIKLLKALPSTERSLVFVQYKSLTDDVANVFQEAGISTLNLSTGTTVAKQKTLRRFTKEPSAPKVLLLEVDSANAAGANLTIANNVFFVSPVVSDTQQEYDAWETQAIGRVRRYGQEKTVRIWRFVAKGTIDEDIVRIRAPQVLEEAA